MANNQIMAVLKQNEDGVSEPECQFLAIDNAFHPQHARLVL
jgi:hypothetical protein